MSIGYKAFDAAILNYLKYPRSAPSFIELLDLIISNPRFNPNEKDERGFTPIMNAIDRYIFQCTGTNPLSMSPNEFIWTVHDHDLRKPRFYWTLHNPRREFVELLFRLLEDDRTVLTKHTHAQVEKKGRPIFSLAHSIAKFGSAPLASRVFNDKMINTDEKDGSNRTPLTIAAMIRNFSIVEVLLKTKRVDVNHRVDGKCPTVISAAAMNGSTSTVKMLLDDISADILAVSLEEYCLECKNGLSIQLKPENTINWQRAIGKMHTALSLAVAFHHPDVVELILATQATGRNPHNEILLSENLLPSVRYYLPANRAENRSDIPRVTETLKVLLSDLYIRQNINQTDKSGETALSIAIRNDLDYCVELLLDVAEVDVNQRNWDGLNTEDPEDMCPEMDKDEVRWMQVQDLGGHTPLLAAVTDDDVHPQIVKRLLLCERVDIHARDRYGMTSSEYATQNASKNDRCRNRGAV